MEKNKNRVSVFVAGQRFNILTDKSEKYVMDIASGIDARINSLVLSGNMTRERAAVLTALDYADDIELDKENLAAVKEQIKDYVLEIERLQDNNTKLTADYNMLKAEYERLIAERQSAEDAQKALKESEEQRAALQKQVFDREEKLKKSDNRIVELEEALQRSAKEAEALREQAAKAPEIEEVPLPEEPPVKEEPVITAEDDLFFDEEEPVKPDKKKKNRHEHNHVNPYQQKAKQKEQKGYTQQRQYTFFDINEEK